MDLPPLEPCRADKRGRHHLSAILPGEDSGDITLYCEMCGALRRAPASGSILAERLDDLTPAEIERAFGR